MVGLTAVRNNQSSNSASTNDVDYHQLEKFWNNLSPQARQDLLKIDKQTLFEHARKSMYCSRCYGLLLEGFVQIVTYGKSIQEAAVVNISYNMPDASKSLQDGRTSASNVCKDEIKDPSLHPWGGLTTTRDGSLTLLDCYACTKTLKGLQIVFDSARLRERERRMLYPDACGGGDRGWISQSIPSYGRVHGMREICALHTARLSSDSLVDFWSALGEETTRSLFRMKEEDFIERLMHRFDNKRFCRDCRRNVLREFKELKRARKEPRCNSDYCVADTAFLYKVSNASVHADWHQTFADSVTSYHHFDWAVGTGEGKCDIQEFENVGLNGSAQITGLDLGGLNACFITLRAWKLDGRCTELSVKAHALKGEECMHRRLTVADGFVSITTGDSIQRFFEHAEEAEEEDDDDSLDKDGSDLDGECSLPQKHAKSPELAREFLLDASIVIFKEQVERAFREGTARQNAHSIFVCLALKLLEERLGLACKDIITFEKQMKLLEEEEKERREEEEQKERKKMKEREKKLRRKERLKGKYKDTEEKTSNLEETPSSNISKEELLLNADEVVNEAVGSKDAVSTNGETVCDRQVCSNIEVEGPFLEVEDQYVNHGISPEQMKASHGKLQPRKPVDQSLKWYDRHQFSFVAEDGPKVGRSIPRYHSDNSQNNSRVIYVANRQLNANHQKTNLRSSASRNSEKFHCGNGRMNERLEGHSCGCNHVCDYQTNNDLPVSAIRTSRGSKYMVKSESVLDVPKHLHGGSKYCQAVRSKSKVIIGSNYHGKKDSIQFRKVWEPLEAQKRCPRSNSASDIPSINSGFKIEQASSDSTKSSSELCSSSEDIGDSTEINHQSTKMRKHIKEKGEVSRSEAEDGTAEPTQAACAMKSSCSNSDNCSSCPSEGDSNTPSPNDENPGSSSTSDSECVSQQTELRVDLGHNGVSDNVSTKAPEVKNRVQTSVIDQPSLGFVAGGSGNSHYAYPSIEPPSHPSSDQNSTPSSMGYKSHAMFPDRRYHHNLCLQMFQTPSNVGYYAHQNLISWAPFPASGLYPHANSYLYPGFLGYGLDANQGLCMPYEAMHHFTTRMISGGPTIPFSNPAQGPAPPTNGIYVEKKPQLSKQSTGGKLADSTIYRERPSEASRPGGRRDLLAEACQENSGFSLFQFGVPFGVPFGMPVDASNTKLPEDGEKSDASSMVPTDAVKDSFPDCCEEEDTTIEQYNLFAANCGTMFSFP